MRLKLHSRIKDGKEHRYWSVVESVRCSRERVVQRHLLYLGELNDSQQAGWTRCLEAIDGAGQAQQIALFPADRALPVHAQGYGVQVRLEGMRLERPRQWGACWLFLQLWEQLQLDTFWRPLLPDSREGTSWYHTLVTLCAYRLIDPGSEWRLHRLWFEQSALGDLLDEDFGLVAKDNLYRALDQIVVHKEALFSHLQTRWADLFGAKFDVLLYDLTSTYFECEAPAPEGLRRFGFSRDKRSDCVQVVIALIVTPEGFPLAYEVLPGNTADKTTLRKFLAKIEKQYGAARRTWVMDRGIPTEEVLAEMRSADGPPVQYLVGTPKGRLGKLEAELLKLPWQQARTAGVRVKLLPKDGEVFVCVESPARVAKERAMRQRRLRKLIERLQDLQRQRPSYEALLLKLGAAKKEAGRDWSHVQVTLPARPTKKAERRERVDFSFRLDRARLRVARRREGRYLLRSNLTEADPAKLWAMYLQLTEVEQAFKDLKHDLSVRPVYHQKDSRIEAHIMVCFLAYCTHITLRQRLRRHAPGLTPRQVLDHLGKIQLIDVHLPTTDGRELLLRRRTEPNQEQSMLLAQLQLELPAQPPPKIGAANVK